MAIVDVLWISSYSGVRVKTRQSFVDHSKAWKRHEGDASVDRAESGVADNAARSRERLSLNVKPLFRVSSDTRLGHQCKHADEVHDSLALKCRDVDVCFAEV